MKRGLSGVFVFSLVAFLFVFSFQFVLADDSVVKTDTSASIATTDTQTASSAASTSTSASTTSSTTTTPADVKATVSTDATTTASTDPAVSKASTETTPPSSGTQPPATTSTSAIPQKYANEKLEGSTSLTPGGFFYGWEKYVRAPFRSDEDNARQKALEIKSAVEKGDINSAKKAYESYKEYASKLEKEADPAKKEQIQKDAAAIKNTMKDVASKITDEKDRKELVDGVVAQTELNAKAVEVADKINTLCTELAKLDPNLFDLKCKVGDDAPGWKKKQYKQLTDVQREEVKKFKDTMVQCMKTQGKECKCDAISIKDFALRCKIIAPLADKCENGGDKVACEKMDDATKGMEDLLPEYLQDTFAEVQQEMNKEQFSQFMPKECIDAKAKTPQECALVMIEIHAPEECKAELKRQKVTNERDARRICEEIMFKQNAPKECIAAGIKTPQECGPFMCKNNFPQQCIDAGLSCDDRNAPRKCQELMGAQGSGKKQGFAFGKSCSGVQDKEERLKCFDEVASNVQEAGKEFSGAFGPENFGSFNGDFDDHFVSSDSFGGPGTGGGRGKGNWPQECTKVGATTKETCEKVMIQSRQGQFKKQRDYEENFARQCMDKGGRWDCGFSSIDPSNPCRCFDDGRKELNSQGQFGGKSQFDSSQNGQQCNFPEQCRQAGAITSDACRKVMDQFGQQQREQGDSMRNEGEQRFKEQQDQFRQQQDQWKQQQEQFKNQQNGQQPSQEQFNCPPGQQCPSAGQQMPPPNNQPSGSQPPQEGQQSFSNIQPPSGGSTTTGGNTGTTSGTSDSTSTNTGTSGGTTSGSTGTSTTTGGTAPATGGVITGFVVGDNSFLKYYFKR